MWIYIIFRDIWSTVQISLIAKRWSLHLCKLWLIYATSVRHVMAKPENILITPIVKKLQSETFHFLLNNGNVSVNLLGGCRKVNHTYIHTFQIWDDESFSPFVWFVLNKSKKFFFEKPKILSHVSHIQKKKPSIFILLIKVSHSTLQK